jgi:hypothetical protein
MRMAAAAFVIALLPCRLPAGEPPAPALLFEAGTVLPGGHELRETTLLPAQSGPAVLKLREGPDLHWRVAVENGETRLLQPDGRWAAKAEYYQGQRNGRSVCLVYQTIISPEWAVRGVDRPADAEPRADFAPADDRIYAFRDTPCP